MTLSKMTLSATTPNKMKLSVTALSIMTLDYTDSKNNDTNRNGT